MSMNRRSGDRRSSQLQNSCWISTHGNSREVYFGG
uniref:Uncharacterized protein n=1 Tax=Arundo donax TaxID=35708 RepID=A0A0A9BJX3_ARUDO